MPSCLSSKSIFDKQVTIVYPRNERPIKILLPKIWPIEILDTSTFPLTLGVDKMQTFFVSSSSHNWSPLLKISDLCDLEKWAPEKTKIQISVLIWKLSPLNKDLNEPHMKWRLGEDLNLTLWHCGTPTPSSPGEGPAKQDTINCPSVFKPDHSYIHLSSYAT